jgi:hypothetical protein
MSSLRGKTVPTMFEIIDDRVNASADGCSFA